MDDGDLVWITYMYCIFSFLGLAYVCDLFLFDEEFLGKV